VPHRIRPSLQSFVDRLNRRSVLTAEEQQAVLDMTGHAEQVDANRDFVRAGERVEHSCLVVAGLAVRFDQGADGGRQITAVHLPGDMCDLRSAVLPESTSSMRALSTSTIIRVPHTALRSASARYPAIAEAFWRDCMVDASIVTEWLANIGRRDARKRVAHLLCELAVRCLDRLPDSYAVLHLQMNQQQLAEATGITAVHANRTLQSLRADGLVDWRNGNVSLPDWEALCALADFDRAYLQLTTQPEQRIRIM
jgi:CRP-like cAMP-binding protein